jgi:hypothetical protein
MGDRGLSGTAQAFVIRVGRESRTRNRRSQTTKAAARVVNGTVLIRDASISIMLMSTRKIVIRTGYGQLGSYLRQRSLALPIIVRDRGPRQ